MNRKDLVKHLMDEGCQVLREGAKHTILIHSETARYSTLPRHVNINEFLARRICRDLGIRPPGIR